MKSIKLMVTLALCAMTLVATAAPTAVAKISIASSSNKGNDQLILVEDASCSPAIVSGEDIVKIMNDANDYSINLYAVMSGSNLSMVGTNLLKDLALTFQTNKSETDYTMTFSNVSGTIKLYDAVADTEVTLSNGGTYSFTATATSTIADRFIINRTDLTPKICFNYEKLQIANATQPISVKKDGADITGSPFAATTTEIDLSAQAAGRYVVNFEGKDYQIDVKVKDIPEAKYHIVTP